MLSSQVVDLDGVLVSRFALHLVLALAIVIALRAPLAWIGIRRLFWNPPLVECALLIIVLGLLEVGTFSGRL